MNADQWSSIRRLLDEALDHPKDRPAILAELRSRDPEACDELERLLTDLENDEPEAEPPISKADLTGQRIGPYMILREIGRGGAATVVLAAREEGSVHVEVALKLLYNDFLRGVPRRAFQRELRVLARLNHPHIARLLDWGNMPGGLVYLAIEYVEGHTITDYCTKNRLGLSARLCLFQQVCQAVEHAHRNLVVHRDLKPSNIFVTGGNVKLLDFGIAADLDSPATATTILRRALTPAYASPEQIQGLPVTVATDVYSLGLVLYELLAGRLPESTEVPPSKRAVLPEVGSREIAGDLDGIVLRAIQKEPSARYASVEQFAADIQRFREGLPVLARGASRFYVAGRFLRRNRFTIAAVSLAAAALLATTAVAVWNWRAANRDYQQLRAFAEVVISNVNSQTFASPVEAERQMSEAIARSLDQLANGRQDDEELQLQIASAYVQLGQAQGVSTRPNAGDPVNALASLRKAYQISMNQWRAKADRMSGTKAVEAGYEIGLTQPDPAPAVAFLSSAVDATDALLSRYPNDPEVLRQLSSAHGVLAQRQRAAGNLMEAVHDAQRSIELADRALAIDPNDINTLRRKEVYTGELGNILRVEGRLDESLAQINQALQIARRIVQTSPGTFARREAAFKLLGRCETLRAMKRYADARRDASEAMAVLRSIVDADARNDQAKDDLSLAFFRGGSIEFDDGRIADALAKEGEALSLRQDQYSRHSTSLLAWRNYQASLVQMGEALLAERRDKPAAANFEIAITTGQKLVKLTPSEISAAAQLAAAYRGESTCAWRAGRRGEADDLLREAVQMARDNAKRSPLDVGLSKTAQSYERELAQVSRRLEAHKRGDLRPVTLR